MLGSAGLGVPCPPATAAQAIGYREAFDALDGRIDRAAAMERTVVRTRQYAKRQRTWFRHQADVRWVDAGGGRTVAEIAADVYALLKTYGGYDPIGLR